jgi:hypothetical protein
LIAPRTKGSSRKFGEFTDAVEYRQSNREHTDGEQNDVDDLANPDEV